MKKRIVFMLFLGMLISCSENIQYNNDPTIQGLKDNVAWESFANSGVATGTKLVLTGISDKQSVTLKMKLPEEFITQTDESTYIGYTLGTGTTNQAIFTAFIDGKEYLYKTANGVGDGEIVVTNYDGVTISGTFRFNAINSVANSDQETTVNFNKGVFYKIPITFN